MHVAGDDWGLKDSLEYVSTKLFWGSSGVADTDGFFSLLLSFLLAFLSTLPKWEWFGNSYLWSPKHFRMIWLRDVRFLRNLSPGREWKMSGNRSYFLPTWLENLIAWMSDCCYCGNECSTVWHLCLSVASGALERRGAFDLWAQISLSTLRQRMQGIKWIYDLEGSVLALLLLSTCSLLKCTVAIVLQIPAICVCLSLQLMTLLLLCLCHCGSDYFTMTFLLLVLLLKMCRMYPCTW